GGLVRTKNVLSVLMQCFSITALVTVLWVVYGYTLAFDQTGMEAGTLNLRSFIGGFAKIFSKGVSVESIHPLAPTIPETVFYCFQLTFAIITPALIIGAFAERMKFSALMWFMGLWFTLVYLPVCHMVWAGDGSFMGSYLGVLDFAGGTVVHINAGIAALICALVLGKRHGYGHEVMAPHNMGMTVTGAAMLWVGWFGFNAGSAVSAGASAGMAMLVTHAATATATLVWMAIEWIKHGKPSALGAATGAVAGLVAITPASGFVGPMGALCIGAAAGGICFWSATSLKRMCGYDDSLDAFGVHGVGGTVGAILTGVFASSALGGVKADLNIVHQVGMQLLGSAITVVYCGVLTLIILKVIDAAVGLRASLEDEVTGLDLTQHGEVGYNL
ncbi:MAG TPA: ammonium transporter, partial [Candidatus Hydrogenedentes bacterium]|nr:ammonium transporter [Candidatus Hydrogenedentota bacterium]